MPLVKLIKTQKIGLRYKKIYDIPKILLMRLYDYDKTNQKINEYIKIKQQINPFELINQINNSLDEIWSNRSKRIIRDKNYFKEKEKLKEIESLLKKEVIYG